MDKGTRNFGDKNYPRFSGSHEEFAHVAYPQTFNKSFEQLANLIRFPRPYYIYYLL